MEAIKNIFRNFFLAGLQHEDNFEEYRKVLMINWMISVFWVFIFALGTVAYLQNHMELVLIEIFLLFLSLALHLKMKKTGDYVFCSRGAIAIVSSFYVFLFATGGVDNSAFVWIFTFPLIAFYLLGTKEGAYTTTAIFIAMILVFLAGPYLSFITNYEVNIIVRSIPAYILISLFSYAMDRIREIVQGRLKDSKNKLQENVNRLEKLNSEKQALIMKLRETLGEVKTLRTILPICSICKNIRNDEGYWEKVEKYFHSHSGTLFSQSVCPECAKKHYSEIPDGDSE